MTENTTAAPARPVEVGDIFVASWGYDQTNIDFYLVTGLTPKRIKIRKMPAAMVGTHGQQNAVVPDVESSDLGPEMLKTVNLFGGRPSVKITSYAWAYRRDNLDVEYETDSTFGH